MPYLLPLSDPAAEQAALTGGKAAGLARLARHGFPVPLGLVVTTDAYHAVLAAIPGFAARAAALPAEPDAAAAAALRAKILAAPVPAALETELAAALAASLSDAPYAVRSSATSEDGAAASFAGQHDTVLGCSGLPAILAALRTCFASAWQDRAIAYRRRHALDPAPMAVVVQRMLDPSAAGVAFTLDPVGGRLDEVHISAHPGLGTAVVDGEAEVDRFIVTKPGLTLRDATGPRATLCLSAEQAVAIAAAACRIEQAFAAPQDIEWAIDAHGLHILQARPITAIPPRWTRDESAERFPNPVTPLAWDFADAGFHAALAASFARMGLPPLREKWFDRFDGWIYGNQTAVDLYLGRPLLPDGGLEGLRAALPGLLRRFAWVDELPGEWALTLDRFLIGLGRLRAEHPAGQPPAAVWAHIQQVNAVGRDYFRHNIAISIGHAVTHKALAALLAHILPAPEAAAAYDTLVAPVQTRTAALNHLLDQLATIARADPALARIVLGAGPGSVPDLAAFPAFEAAFAALLADHGHRELDIDPYHPTWADAPWTALQAITARLDDARLDTARLDTARPAAPALLSQRIAANALLRRLSATLPAALVDDLAPVLAELARLACLYTELDDHEHYQTARLGPLLRRAVAALGAPLAASALIDDPLDLFFAREGSLATAVHTGAWAALLPEIAAAKRYWQAQQHRSPPWSLGSEPDAPPPTSALPTSVLPPSAPPPSALRGIPGSPGHATGPAYIVRSPADFAACPQGAILVVRATTPAWTALFARAAGIVAESGGPLSHGAIAAREQGIPAIMAVRAAMDRFTNGQPLRLDGAQGTVEALYPRNAGA